MRPATATAAAVTTLFGVGAAAVAAGRYASDAALRAPHDRPLPAEPRLTLHATAPGQVTLTRSLASLRPGTYGLANSGVHAVVGPVLERAPHSADTVVRRLERVTHGSLEPGARLRLTPQLHRGDPYTALGLDHTDVGITGELGTLPAWFVPAVRSTWVITVHGLGATREHPMNVMDFLHRQQFPVLDPAYRGDPGAPRSPDGLGHLGESEWRDVDAAIRHALRGGAERVVLYGWSTGATMALHAATRSALRHHVSGLVLDSPVLDWETTLRALAAARHTPAPLLPLAVRAAQGRTGLRAGSRFDVPVPTLVLHGPGDRIAPWSFSRELALRSPELATLHPVPDAPHGAMWNADPAAYEEALRRFLTPLM
ncbi:alpha/beta hydrolase [Streptomyces beijiangensis]|uniref:Alpha/beta hydrolase n=1 Tax=Streptomyces beijiangensis TaxID=163361 RepID=A0A939F8U8_9ACTN|nr:alpha/beta fold hydrolase [Streptomyces beijiangensis]MBO0514746.1 alpha/beta hydrolase [Streptomyces beijiangensis]